MFLKPHAGVVACLFLTLQVLAAAEPQSADDAAIRKLISAFEQAENKHDGAAIAGLFLQDSPDRETVSKRVGSEGGFWTERSPSKFRVDSIRALHPDIALVDTTATWYQAGLMGGKSQQMLIVMKSSEGWRISAYRMICKPPAGR